MKIILDIKDSKADFVMELLHSLSFVKAEPLSPYKNKILTEVRRGVKEVNLIKAGKLKGIPAKDLMNEL